MANTKNYHHYIDNIKTDDKSIGNLLAIWNNDEKTADITVLQAGFWLPERLGNKPNPLAGSGIGKFLMIIFDWICKQLDINTIELDNTTKPINGLPSYYTKFGFEKKGNEHRMIKNKTSPELKTENMLMSLGKYKPTEYWKWQLSIPE